MYSCLPAGRRPVLESRPTTSGSPPVLSISESDHSFSILASSFACTLAHWQPLWRFMFFSKRAFKLSSSSSCCSLDNSCLAGRRAFLLLLMLFILLYYITLYNFFFFFGFVSRI